MAEVLNHNFNCHFCSVCDGRGCVAQMPGMGGPKESINFKLNVDAWKNLSNGPIKGKSARLRLAPVTGALQNVGYGDERSFYFDIAKFCVKNNIALSIGDGTPDFKIQYGIEAVRAVQDEHPDTKAAVFIKPYSNEKIMQRVEWASDIAEIIGVDIDSYNIITMRNLVQLEKKNSKMLKALKDECNRKGFPFAIKGVFTPDDIELVKNVRPDIAYISNHGGRVETVEGSTGEFLKNNFSQLIGSCGKLWIDGGIRYKHDIKKAASYGVDTVLLGRPIISALCSPNRPILLNK